LIYEGSGLINYVKAVQLLRKRIKNNNYDIIHAHYSYSSLVTILSFPKVPLITSFMGSDILGFRKIDKIIKIVVEKFSDIIIVKSRQMAEKISHRNKLVIIPNGVNCNTFKAVDKFLAKKRLGLHPGIKYILWVGNSKRKEKNFKLVREVLRIIKETNKDIELIPVFGESQKKLNEYYSACDVFLLTSLYEGSPNVLKEAMACNCPIISTDVGDATEVVRNTEGCYITSFDPNDVAKKIKIALNFGKRTNGRDHIKDLEINVIAKKIINVYEEILNIDE
ncbi:unnamed protein product, partial [marine sediment metagenome]